MKKRIFLFNLWVSLSLTISLSGQDTIHRKSGETIQVRIMEVTTEELKYRRFDEPDGPLYAIDKAVIAKVVYENGRTEQYPDHITNPELYAGQHQHAIKTGFLAPLTGQTNFAFEKSLQPGKSFELKLGIIGLGKNTGRNADGLFLSGAFRFYRTPDFYLRGMRYAHVLKGAYIEPEIIAGRYTVKQAPFWDNYGSDTKNEVTFASLMLNFGKQWVFNDIFLVDLSTGVGYVVDSGQSFYHYAVSTIPDSGLALSCNLSVGFLF